MSQKIDYDAIRKRVEKRVKARQEWVAHLTAYIIVNVALWAIWWLTGGNYFPWPALVTLGWGIGMGIHTATYLTEASMEQAKEAAIDREIRREKMRVYGDPDYDDSYMEKPKRRAKERERGMRLTDDGELEYEDDADSEELNVKQKGL
ncbi:MAG: 2TM domain-containing protein [Anaerolineae bacterium]|nr:2TM domain-containing protein [Anaerolineae bacterium]